MNILKPKSICSEEGCGTIISLLHLKCAEHVRVFSESICPWCGQRYFNRAITVCDFDGEPVVEIKPIYN